MLIQIIQSTVNGRWSYCPAESVALLRPELDDEALFETARDALAFARRDRRMPRGTQFEIVIPPAVREKFAYLANHLSPENLSHDGELSGREIRAWRAHFMARWRVLERDLGRRVTETEIWAVQS